jgi:outer membrane protein assembly factor BamB
MERNGNEQHSTEHIGRQNSQPRRMQAPPSLVPTVLSRLGLGEEPALGDMRVNELVAALGHHEWYVRTAAVRELGRLGERAPVEPLQAALDDEDSSVRAAAVRALGRLAERAPVDRLIAALHDRDWHVRETAALVLGSLDGQVPAEPLAAALNDQDVAVRQAAADALQQVHPTTLSRVTSSPGAAPVLLSYWQRIPRALGAITQSLYHHIHVSESLHEQEGPILSDLSEEYVGSGVAQEARPSEDSRASLPQTLSSRRSNKLWRTVALGFAVLVIAVNAVAWAVLSQRLHPSASGKHASSTVTPAVSISPSWNGHEVGLTIVDGVAYAGSVHGTVSALRITDGSLLWRYTTRGSVDESPLVVNGVVYVDSADKSVYALRASDGSLLWRYTTAGGFGSLFVPTPIMANGVVYTGTQDGVVYALRTSDGSLLWHYKTGGPIYETLEVVNGVIYVFSDNGGLYAMRASDGALLWHTTNGHIYNPPTIFNGVAYFITYFSNSDKDTLYAMRASDGSLLWRYTSPDGSLGSPLVINGVVYAIVIEPKPKTASTGQGGFLLQTYTETVPTNLKKPAKGEGGIASVYALRASDGAVLWHYKLDYGGMDSGVTWLTAAGGAVYLGTTFGLEMNYVYALRNSDGALLWRSAADYGPPYNGSIVNGVAYLIFDDFIYALRTNDGVLLWRYLTFTDQ